MAIYLGGHQVAADADHSHAIEDLPFVVCGKSELPQSLDEGKLYFTYGGEGGEEPTPTSFSFVAGYYYTVDRAEVVAAWDKFHG
jgi:hypothetical protein